MDQFFINFCDSVAMLDNRVDVQSFFKDLLTHTEEKMLAKRFKVAVMLVDGQDYETISEELEVSNTTIAKVNNLLKTGASSLYDAAKKVAEDEGPFIRKSTGKKNKYIAGNLLAPAIEEGANFVARKIVERRRKKKLEGK